MGVILTSIILFILILISHHYFASQYRLSKENLEKKARSIFDIISEKVYYKKDAVPEGKTSIDSVKFEILNPRVIDGFFYAEVVAKDVYSNDFIEKKDIKAKVYEDYKCNQSPSNLCINL